MSWVRALLAAAVLAVGAASYLLMKPGAPLDMSPKAVVSRIKIVAFTPKFDPPQLLPHVRADLTVQNDNPYPIDLVVYRCEFQDAVGAKVHEVSVHKHDLVPAKSRKRYENEILGWSKDGMHGASCVVAEARWRLE